MNAHVVYQFISLRTTGNIYTLDHKYYTQIGYGRLNTLEIEAFLSIARISTKGMSV